jgi:putative FmdB family regulatory protein
MPIFEYVCEDCKKPFEAILLGSGEGAREPECPACHSRSLKQQISVFSVGAGRGSAPAAQSQSCGAPACCMGSGGCATDA